MASRNAVAALTGSNPSSVVKTTFLNFEEGKDYDIEDAASVPLERVKRLGHGSCGTVEKVRHKVTGDVYALKISLITHIRHLKSQKSLFANEINNIRSLGGHLHFVRVFASYTTKEELGLLLLPVADMDLTRLLEAFTDSKQNSNVPSVHDITVILERAFGCLLSALAFMGNKRIRHKDIKPSNILIHNGLILFTDFGSSLLSEANESSSTQGHPGSVTWMYCAPEVHGRLSRNSKTDIYSLGCVFIEILAVLTDGLSWDKTTYFHKQMKHLHEQLRQMYIPMPLKLNFLPKIIIFMTEENAESRPKAYDICGDILRESIFGCEECQKQFHTFQNPRNSPVKETSASEGTKKTAEIMAPKETGPPSSGQNYAPNKQSKASPRSQVSSPKEALQKNLVVRGSSINNMPNYPTNVSNSAVNTRQAYPQIDLQQTHPHYVQSPSPQYPSPQYPSPQYSYMPVSEDTKDPHETTSQYRQRRQPTQQNARHVQQYQPNYTQDYGLQSYNSGHHNPQQIEDTHSNLSFPHQRPSKSEHQVPHMREENNISRSPSQWDSSNQRAWRSAHENEPVPQEPWMGIAGREVAPRIRRSATTHHTPHVSPYPTATAYSAPSLITERPAIANSSTPTSPQFSDWTWSPPHQDYYRIKRDEYGEVVIKDGNIEYIWSKDTRNRLENRQPISATIFSPQHEFVVRHANFFSLGKVFAVLFSKPARTSSLDSDSDVPTAAYGLHSHIQIYQFVVVNPNRGSCDVCRLRTYNGRATTKSGLVPSEHAIAHSSGSQPSLVSGETWIEKDPIAIIMADGVPPLCVAMRINFAVSYPVEQSVKVKEIGEVHPNYIHKLVRYWSEERTHDPARLDRSFGQARLR